MISAEKLSEIVLNCVPDTEAVYLFGSFADGSETEKSDIDIALLLPHNRKLSFDETSAIKDEISSAFGIEDVDLVNLRDVSTVLQKEVVAKGIRLYEKDKRTVDEFEMYVYSFYQKLNEERKEIIEEFISSGRCIDL